VVVAETGVKAVTFDGSDRGTHPTMSTILVTGASGFVGSHHITALLGAGHRVVALARTEAAGETVVGRVPGARRADVEVRIGDVTHPDTLAPALEGVDAVLHLAAIPRDFNHGADLRLVNTEGTRALLVAMQRTGVRRLVHMGAMGVVDDPNLHYASSKAKAEALVRASDLDWTILKPSLQFGEGDGFFNIIAGLVRISPGIVPVPGDGAARFQPIHVDDVATVTVRALADPATVGVSFDLGGPRYWTYREITREVLVALGKKRAILPMPVVLIRLVAGMAELVRIPFPVATDQLRQLRLDNIGPLDLIPTRFGFEPRPMEGALGYLRIKQRSQIVAASADA
jgi:NADH dehydrogenase